MINMINKIKRMAFSLYMATYMYLPITDLPLAYVIIRGM